MNSSTGDRTTTGNGKTRLAGPLSTKRLMTTSAVSMGLLGLAIMLFPDVILGAVSPSAAGGAAVLVKLLGAAYLGMAVLDWMARENLIGGIYSRPVAVGNFTHFLAAAIVLAKGLTTTSAVGPVGAGALLFSGLAAGFGYVTFSGGGQCG